MLNEAVGSLVEIEGQPWIETRAGAAGHAVYGPYEQYEPGRYLVEFMIAPVPGQSFRRDMVCAVIDVATGTGTAQLAQQRIHLSALQQGAARLVLPFTVKTTQRLEFRVQVNGRVPLVIADRPMVVAVPAEGADQDALIAASRFPEPDEDATPAFFAENRDLLRDLHTQGVAVRIAGDQVVLRVDTVSFFARTRDDFNFVGEVFFNNTYNVFASDDLCMIDIGMNIGLVSLMFAAKPNVREVHAFEPFRATFDRALANVALNPDLAGKIVAHNLGLSDHDRDGDVTIAEVDASGSMCIVPVANGIPVHVSVRDAATTLRPIVDAARAAGRKVVVKVDCEGSEFAVFESLERGGLLDEITGFMVEWHRMFDTKTQADLFAPLLRRGFMIFDQSPPRANGFFYAVRTGG